MKWIFIIFSWCFMLPAIAADAEFELAAPGHAATILVLPGEPESLRLAAEDLARDCEKITGQKPRIVSRIAECDKYTVFIGSASHKASAKILEQFAPQSTANLRDKWEAYSAQISTNKVGPIENALVISGSDERGAIFGLYAFIEKYLGVDPLYFWTDREPQKRERLASKNINIQAGEPTFRFRGWFINDEDLLTEWKAGGGQRKLDYPYYHQVTHPDVIARVVEAMVRLQYNLVIPASFIDIRNPAERRLIEVASQRGLFVSMHHVEPMGVSAFGFKNYWQEKGRDVPFAFHTHPKEFEEIWRVYANEWAKFPNVIWQIGLRGVADRPFWLAAAGAPASDAERGKVISDAMQLQREIIRGVDKRPQPLITTTLWAEGSGLMRAGAMKIPEGVTAVFSDNSPGWKWQADFYETPREKDRNYGVYYHHALWGSGPHLVQAVSPQKSYEMFRLAVERKANSYAIMNVANVREFALGVDASARMLRDFASFNPDQFLSHWCRERFGGAGEDAKRSYEKFFASYAIDERTGLPLFLDGLTLSAGNSSLNQLLKKLDAPLVKPTAEAPKKSPNAESDWGRKYLPGLGTGAGLNQNQLLAKARQQRAGLEEASALADAASARMDGKAHTFFETNLIAQLRLQLGLTRWLEAALEANLAWSRGDGKEALTQLRAAQQSLQEIRAVQTMLTRGKWQDWYRGDRKMNLTGRAEKITEQVLVKLEERLQPAPASKEL